MEVEFEEPVVESAGDVDRVIEVPLTAIARVEENRFHGGMDDERLNELAASIGQVGVQQPIVVRRRMLPSAPAPGATCRECGCTDERACDHSLLEPDRAWLEHLGPCWWVEADLCSHCSTDPVLEIVAGERRWRAAAIAGLQTIPAIVRSLTDEAALVIRMTENLQREDLHPYDEAMALQQLMEVSDTVDEVAQAIGKTRSYVYHRLRLLKLKGEPKELLLAGDLTVGHAEIIARLAPELQQDALDACFYRGHAGDEAELAPVSELKRYVATEVERRLDAAAWEQDDADLVPEAGPCSTCPKRDPEQAPVCMDPDCYRAKGEALVARRRAELEKTGEKVTLVSTDRGGNTTPGVISSWAWKEMKKKVAGAERVLIVAGPGAGRLTYGKIERYGTAAGTSDGKLSAQQLKMKIEQLGAEEYTFERRRISTRVMRDVFEAAKGKPPDPDVLLCLAMRFAVDVYSDFVRAAVKAIGLDPGQVPRDVFQEWLQQQGEHFPALVLLAASSGAEGNWLDRELDPFDGDARFASPIRRLAEHYAVDVEAIRAEEHQVTEATLAKREARLRKRAGQPAEQSGGKKR